MNENYFFYYTFCTHPKKTENIIDASLFTDNEVLNEMPEYEPSEKALNNIFQEL